MSAAPQRHAVESLRDLEPLSSLSRDQVADLLSHSRIESHEPGSELFRAGDLDQQAVYLLRGEIELRSADGAAAMLRAGTPETRHPLADEQPRRHAAVARTRTEVLRVDKELLDTMLTWSQISAPEEAVVMSEDGIITVNKADWLKTMIKSPTFRRLPPASIEQLLQCLEPVAVQAGQVIIRQGDRGDFFYMIEQGIALVTRNPDNDEDSIEIAELNKGSSFGEAALISDKPRNATVSMMTDGILLRLSKEDFDRLLTQPTLQWVDFEQAMAQIGQGARWIDVRLPAEFEHSHLPGAINVPMSLLHRSAHALSRGTVYICYCQTGRRSSAAAFVLKNYRLNAYVLRGGLEAIAAAPPRDR
jgi:CRP-like cAMP-binding protein